MAESMGYLSKLFKKEEASVASVLMKEEYDSSLHCGDPALSWCLGGWTKHRPNLIYGSSGSGKSALAQKGAAAAQKERPGSVVLINDSEYYYYEQPERAARLEKFGIDPDNTLIIPGNTIDAGFSKLNEIEKLLEEGKIDISAWIIDSWSGFENKAAAKKMDGGDALNAGDSHRGNAKTMNPVLTRIIRLCAQYKITCFIVQHVMVNQEQYGPKFLLLGGEKLRHLCDSILYVETIARSDARLGADGEALMATSTEVSVGKKIRAKAMKTRNTVEGKTVEFWMDFENCRFAKQEDSLFVLATNLGIIDYQKNEERDSDGNPIIDKKTGKPKFKKSSKYEFPAGDVNAQDLGTVSSVKEHLKDKNFFAKVLDACMKSKKTHAAEGEVSDVGLNNA